MRLAHGSRQPCVTRAIRGRRAAGRRCRGLPRGALGGALLRSVFRTAHRCRTSPHRAWRAPGRSDPSVCWALSSRPSSSSRSNVTDAMSPTWLSGPRPLLADLLLHCVRVLSVRDTRSRLRSAPAPGLEQRPELRLFDAAHVPRSRPAAAQLEAALGLLRCRSRRADDLVPGRRVLTRGSRRAAAARAPRARRRTTASFAFPPSGGAATRTFQPSPCRPTTRAWDAPGNTRNRRFASSRSLVTV